MRALCLVLGGAALAMNAACGGVAHTPAGPAPTPDSGDPAAHDDAGQAGDPRRGAEVERVEFSELAGGVWLHTSYKSLPGIGLFPSNGLIVQTDDGILLVDTAWDDAQTEHILAWTQETLGAPVTRLVVTHAHDDKMGGVAALHRRGVETYALDLTNADAEVRALTPTSHTLALDRDAAVFAGGAVEVFYPGPGHTRDNLVVYVKGPKVLYGGCLIRPGTSQSLGNTADADVGHWDVAVERLKRRYGEAEHVVPSHGPPGGRELLDHTIERVHDHRAQAETD